MNELQSLLQTNLDIYKINVDIRKQQELEQLQLQGQKKRKNSNDSDYSDSDSESSTSNEINKQGTYDNSVSFPNPNMSMGNCN